MYEGLKVISEIREMWDAAHNEENSFKCKMYSKMFI